jgi:tetratricopeptide (TPR) repeat protein
LEDTAHPLANENGASNHVHAPAANPANGESEPAAAGETTPSSEAALISFLLGKGQSLLNLDKADEALACFDEVLGLRADHSEALVKKGTALEKLRRLNEAAECYDRAIAADHTLTIAYLCKGGLFNRMERYNEALECYELALRTQEKRG